MFDPLHGRVSSENALGTAAEVTARLAEPGRRAALRRAHLLDTPPEPSFDRLTALAQRLLHVPISTVTFVEPDRQFTKSQQGFGDLSVSEREAPLSHSFCKYVVASDATLTVEDARTHPVLRSNVATTELGIVAYLGVPIHSPDGYTLGSFCAINTVPRAWTDDDRQVLSDLAAIAESEIAYRSELDDRVGTEANYRELFDASPDAILLLDPVTEVVLDANESACMMYGFSHEDFVGTSMLALSKDPARGQSAYDQLLAEGGRVRFESVQFRSDGTPVEVAIGSSLVRLDDRPVVLSINRDITARRESERALRQSEARFRQIAEALPQLVWTADAEGETDYINGRWSDYTGLSADDGIIQWGDSIHPDDGATTARRWAHSMSTGDSFEAEYRIRRGSDGQYRWFMGRAEPVRDESGAIVQWFGTSTDIHDLREAQERLRVSSERLRFVGRATSDVVWDWDIENDTVLWNPAVAEVLGWDDAHVTDAAWWIERIHPDDREETVGTFRAVLGGDERVWQKEYQFCRADGTYAFVLDRGYVVRNADGTVARAVGAMLDLSERKAFEAELVAAREVAEAAARLKTAFLANMSHEIRTPLTAILGYAEILADEVQADLREYVEIIERGGQRLLDTLNSILDLAQIEGGDFDITPDSVDLFAEAEHVCTELRPLAAAKGLDIRTVGQPVRALGDRGALGRVLRNLVGNAIKFTSTGSVVIDVGVEDGWACFCVADTGEGISPEFLPELFTEFKQESEGYGRKYEGSGLGLVITRRLLHLMGGEISAESEKGVGSRFTVRLPFASEPEGVFA